MRKTFIYLLVTLLFLSFTSSYALTVSPAKIEVVAAPGATIRDEVELFNEQNDTKTFYTSYENFESRGDSGAPYFVGAEKGLATWIESQEKVILRSGERIKVPYTINVPSTAKPGGYFAAIFFGTQPQQTTGGGEVSIGGKIGILVLLKISGDVEEKAGLVGFGTTEGRRFFTGLPVVFEYGFNNAGGDRVVPRGELAVKNTLRMTSARLLANDREGSVLPNSTRRFEVVWGDQNNKGKGFFEVAFAQLRDFHFGWYTASLGLAYGTASQTANVTYNFFIFPWQILLILASVVAVVYVIFKAWSARFKRKIMAEMMRNK